MNGVQEGMQVLRSALHIRADPVCTGLIHLKGMSLVTPIWGLLCTSAFNQGLFDLFFA